jgi:MFS family permease
MTAEIALPIEQQNKHIVRLAMALAGANAVVFVIGMAACILPFGALARRRGRKAAFLAGTGTGVFTGLN